MDIEKLTRREFLDLPLHIRRRNMAMQAEELAAHYNAVLTAKEENDAKQRSEGDGDGNA